MTLRVAQFFLKIAHLSFSMGPRGPRAYGLRPRLWLLLLRPPVGWFLEEEEEEEEEEAAAAAAAAAVLKSASHIKIYHT